MNTRFSLTLLHYLNQKKPNRNKGFALPMAMMVGLVAVVVGATMVIRAQGGQSEVVSQAAKSTSLAAAETGLTRVQNMMNNVKFVSLYPMSSWTSAMTLSADNSSVTINDTGLNNLVNSVAASTACTSSNADVAIKANDIKAQLASIRLAANGTLTNIDPNDPNKGKFRLVNYTYSGTPGSMPGNTARTGGFVIEGESGTSGNAGKSRIAVEVPITGSSPVSSTDIAPGLWLKRGGINTTGSNSWETSGTPLDNSGNTFDANILFSDCSNGLSDSYVTNVQSQRLVKNLVPGATARKTTLALPSLPPNPSSVAVNLGNIAASVTLPRISPADTTASDGNYHYILNNSANTPITTCTGKGKNKVCTSVVSGIGVTVNKPTGSNVFVYNNLGSITSGTTSLPRSTDVASSDGVYRYLIDSIDPTNGNSTINVSTSEEVSLYVLGDVKFNGSGDLNHNCSGVTDCTPSDLKIYAYATASATPDNGVMCLKGNARVDGLILAPAYDLGKTGNGSWYGSIFGYSWGKVGNCGSNNGTTPSVIQTATWSILPPEFQPTTFSPQVGNPTSYTQQAVQ